MHDHKKTVVAIILLTMVVVFSCLWLSFSAVRNQSTTEPSPSPVYTTKYDFSIVAREFEIGTAGFIPANFPEYNTNDLLSFWSDLNTYAEVYGVHVDWQDTAVLESTSNNYTGDLLVVLGLQMPEDWDENVEDFIEEADRLLNTYPKIRYLGVGNEVNAFYQKYPSSQIENYLEAYKIIYRELKLTHPQIMIFPTYNYETLIGEGYLANTPGARLDMFLELEPTMDAVALTVYPFFDYASPKEIPDDYFSPVLELSKKPLIITETGWPAKSEFSESNKALEEQGFAGSEQEQVLYLQKLVSLANGANVKVLNWAFFNDYAVINQPNPDMPEQALFDSIGLNWNDGKDKEVLIAWRDLKRIPNVDETQN